MKSKVIKVIKHPLFSGSAVMVIGTNLNNVFNYLYHVFMGRLLGPVGYGEMASLFSLIILVGTIPSSLNLSLVKFISGSKNRQEADNFIGWFFSRSLLLGLGLCIIIGLISRQLSGFLNISSRLPVILIGLGFIFMVPSVIIRSALQGQIKFNKLVISLLVESCLKLALGILFVYWGWQVSGSISALFVASIVGILLGMYYVGKFPVWPKKSSVSFFDFTKYSLPIIIYALASTSFYTTDLILVKHYFTATLAGNYAALSTLGKIIIFGAGPISGVMFPIVSKRYTQGYPYQKIFWFGFILTLLACLCVEIIYSLFPGFSVGLLYGHQYIQAPGLLYLFGIFISFFSLSSYLIGFYLSINYTKVVMIPLLAAGLQALGISLFHSSLQSVIIVSIVSCGLMLLLLLAALQKKLAKIGP